MQSVHAAGLEAAPLVDDTAGESLTQSGDAGQAQWLVRDPFGIAVVLHCG
jgi:hypothetical protein